MVFELHGELQVHDLQGSKLYLKTGKANMKTTTEVAKREVVQRSQCCSALSLSPCHIYQVQRN